MPRGLMRPGLLFELLVEPAKDGRVAENVVLLNEGV